MYPQIYVGFCLTRLGARDIHIIMCVETFPDLVREIMRTRGLSQVKLGAMLGLRQSQISNWLHGKSLPCYATLRRMVVVLGMRACELLLLEGGGD